MNREFLESLGLEKEAIDKVMAAHGKAVQEYKSQAEKVEEVTAANETLTTQLAERDKDLKSLKKDAGDNEELSKQLSGLQEKYQQDTEALKSQLETTKLNSAVTAELSKSNARDVDDLRRFINQDELKFDESGKLVGLNSQLESLQKDKAYLFKGDPKPSYQPAGDEGGAGNVDIATAITNPKVNLTEVLTEKGE